MRQEGATFKINGKEHEYADVWHSKKDENGKTIYNDSKIETISSNDEEMDNKMEEIEKELMELTKQKYNGKVAFGNLTVNSDVTKKALEILDKIYG